MSMVPPLASGYRQRTFVGTRTHVSPPSSVLYKGRGTAGTATHSAVVPAINHPWLASTKSTATCRGASPGIEWATHVLPPSEVTSSTTGDSNEAQAKIRPCWGSKNLGGVMPPLASRVTGSGWTCHVPPPSCVTISFSPDIQPVVSEEKVIVAGGPELAGHSVQGADDVKLQWSLASLVL